VQAPSTDTTPKAPGKLSSRVLEKDQKEKEERMRRESKEPLMIIDPVSGLLIPMTESEEGQYIPVSNSGVAATQDALSREKAEELHKQELQIPKVWFDLLLVALCLEAVCHPLFTATNCTSTITRSP